MVPHCPRRCRPRLPNPRILDRKLRIKHYPSDIRQIAIKDLGHDKPTLLHTNQLREPAASLVDRYARRMIIESAIADAIDFFHMDAASAGIRITEKEMIVSFGGRAHNPCLLAADYAQKADPIPWLQNRSLQLRFS